MVDGAYGLSVVAAARAAYESAALAEPVWVERLDGVGTSPAPSSRPSSP